MKPSKLEKILSRFDECDYESNEDLSASIYYAHCALPIYDSSNKDLVVNRALSINFKELKSNAWEIDLAENIASIFRCIVSIERVENCKLGYAFAFVGVEDDAEICKQIFNRVHQAIAYRSRGKIQRSIERVLSKVSDYEFSGEATFAKKQAELKALVADVSDFSACLKSNEFGAVISRYFMTQNKQA
jgi:hypothetical protein